MSPPGAVVGYEAVADLLACPRCRAGLVAVGAPGRALACSDARCDFARRPFDVPDGCPVLVDFADSILDEDELRRSAGGSPIARHAPSAARDAARDVLFGRNQVAPVAVGRFVSAVPAAGDTPLVLIVGGASVGSGAGELYRAPGIRRIGFDIYRTEHTTFLADGHRIPLADGSVQGVWIQAVLEHVLDPWAVVGEIWRVLSAGGVVYAETPFLQQVHEGAYDFTRFTHSGHRWLFRHFAELDSGLVAGPGTQLAWTLEHTARSTLRSPALGKVAKAAFFWTRFIDRVAAPGYALDTASAVYFLGRKAETPLSPKDMPRYYRGGR